MISPAVRIRTRRITMFMLSRWITTLTSCYRYAYPVGTLVDNIGWPWIVGDSLPINPYAPLYAGDGLPQWCRWIAPMVPAPVPDPVYPNQLILYAVTRKREGG